MEAKFGVIIAAFALIFLVNNQNCYVAAKELVVGDDQGWNIPDSPNFYSSWASQQTFLVGDTLAFNFVAPHTVALVDKDSFEKCDTSNPISVINQSPALIPLKSRGQFHFICTVGDGGHCSAGQKLAINVTAAGHHNHHHHQAPAPAPIPTNAVSNLAPPRLGIFASFSLALVLVLGFFY